MDIIFYILKCQNLEKVFPKLLEKLYEQLLKDTNKKAAILFESKEACIKFDQLLWTFSTDAFVPHLTQDIIESNPSLSLKDKVPIIFYDNNYENLNNYDVVVVTSGIQIDKFPKTRLIDIVDLTNVIDQSSVVLGDIKKRYDFYKSKVKEEATLSIWQQEQDGQWKKIQLSEL
jgi:DNA polymerase IIIc chi subunit